MLQTKSELRGLITMTCMRRGCTPLVFGAGSVMLSIFVVV